MSCPNCTCPNCRCQHCGQPKPAPVWVPFVQPAVRCTCLDPWFAIVPPPPCPLHGYAGRMTITFTTTSDSLKV